MTMSTGAMRSGWRSWEAAPEPSQPRRNSLRAPPARKPGDVLRNRPAGCVQRGAEADVIGRKLAHGGVGEAVAAGAGDAAVGGAAIGVHTQGDPDRSVDDAARREAAVLAVGDGRDLPRRREAGKVAAARSIARAAGARAI